MLQFCWFVNTACRGLIWLVCLGLTACPGSFPSSHGEKHPNPKLGWDLDLDKLGCTTSCWGDKTDQIFFTEDVRSMCSLATFKH